MRTIIKITILLLISACSTDYHLRKAVVKSGAGEVLNKLMNEFPDLAQKKEIIFDTIVITQKSFDTIKVMNHYDSLVINNYGNITKVFRHYDTIRLLYIPKTDTIIRPIRVDRFIYSEAKERKNNVLFWVFFSAIILLLILILKKNN